MAEYYPLLSRAVAGLRDAPPEQRKAIYERARQALLGQLRSMQPAVPNEAIDRESAALDEAIDRVESEIPKRSPPGQGVARVDPIVVIPSSRPEAASAPTRPVPPASGGPTDPAPATPMGAPSPPAARPRAPGTPVLPHRPPLAPPRSPSARPAAEALTRIIADRPAAAAPIIRASRTEDEASPSPARVSAALPAAPKLQVPNLAEAESAADLAPERPTNEAAADKSDAAAWASGRDDAVRPAAPRPVTRDRFNPRFAIMVGIAILVAIPIAYAAWRLRDKPEALARSRAALMAAEQADRQAQGKVSNRADGSAASASDQPAPVASPSAPPADATPTTVPLATASGADGSGSASAPAPVTTPAPVVAAPPAMTPAPADPAPVAVAPPAAMAAAPTTPTQPADATQLPVSQRAAFLIDAPDDPQKIKTFVGTVIWRSESVSPGSGQPLMTTVHADVDIPDAAMKLSMTFQKNTEAQFPASHTLDLRFSLLPNNTLGGVKQISVPQMRQDDSPTGDSLVGLPVTITENYFLVGLSRGDPVAQNIGLIKTRNWFDVPMILTSGTIAKITFEKGVTGQQVINDALQSWQ